MRENRLTRQYEYKRKIRANESPELRVKRVANQRKYQKKKIANESVECIEKRDLDTNVNIRKKKN